ncbi:MAG: sensor histidine kinase [Anaerolineales bacterium]|nr:sensor histidine kinase [Anaerolineales bacterium]
MNAVRRAPASADEHLPLPARQMQLYLTFWHFVYLGLLTLLLWETWAEFGRGDVWRASLLTGLALAQTGLYVWSFVLNHLWPLPGWRIGLYFGVSVGLWLLEWRLAPDWQWFGMTYFGQMLGILPPLAAVPGSLLIFALVFIASPDLNLAALRADRVMGPLIGWAASMVLYFFIHYITRTSAARGRLVAELRAAQAKLEAARARDAELAALRERERLARDLHDSLGHALVAISVQLEAIQRLYRVDAERAAAQVDTLKAATRAATDELRRSLAGLRASGLGDRPLDEALRSLAVDTGRQHDLDVTCRVEPGSARLTPAAAEALWRVAQEALTNVARHAQARRVEVTLTFTPEAARLSVRDDGRGLPEDAATLAAAGHYGLSGLRERLAAVGGALTLANDGGVTVAAQVPL